MLPRNAPLNQCLPILALLSGGAEECGDGCGPTASARLALPIPAGLPTRRCSLVAVVTLDIHNSKS